VAKWLAILVLYYICRYDLFSIYIEKSEGINGGIQPTPMGLEQDFKILFRVVTPAPPGFGSGLAWSTQQASKMALFEQ
jgi:hypothetical protein